MKPLIFCLFQSALAVLVYPRDRIWYDAAAFENDNCTGFGPFVTPLFDFECTPRCFHTYNAMSVFIKRMGNEHFYIDPNERPSELWIDDVKSDNYADKLNKDPLVGFYRSHDCSDGLFAQAWVSGADAEACWKLPEPARSFKPLHERRCIPVPKMPKQTSFPIYIDFNDPTGLRHRAYDQGQQAPQD